VSGGDAEGYAEANVGGVCTVQGADYPLDYGSPGHIKRVGSRIICVPDAPRGRDNNSDDEDNDDDDNEAEETETEETEAEATSDRRSVQQQMTAHRDKMDSIYDALDRETANRWRDGK